MSKFKDYLDSDLDVFLDQDEFAELHDIDGQQIPAMLDEDILKLKTRGRAFAGDGIYDDEKVLFIKLSDIGYQPVIGQHLHLDGELCQISECRNNNGMLEITLGANKA